MTHPPDEFTALYQRYSADVFRFALGLCGNAPDADDLTSETFVRVWTSAEPIRVETVKAYLFTIVRNLYRQGLRRRGRETTLESADSMVADNRATPAEHAEHRSELEALTRALRVLKEEDRSALLMHTVHAMPYQQIAESLGMSLATVKIRIHRARLALARLREDQ